eukprot:Sdes_comp20406_c0_seq1m14424
MDERFCCGRDRFVVFSAQGCQCSSEHVEFIRSKQGEVVWLDQIKKSSASAAECFKSLLDDLGDLIFVSFDLDSVQSSDAPGVSCPSSRGLSGQDALEMMFVAGSHPKVALVDLSEFNPEIEDYRTTKLVVNMFYYFLLGQSVRKSRPSGGIQMWD